MSSRPDGSIACDRCGVNLGSGGIDRCVIVAVLADSTGVMVGGEVQNLHFCNFTGLLTPDAAQPGERCVTRVLTKTALRVYFERGGAPLWTTDPEEERIAANPPTPPEPEPVQDLTVGAVPAEEATA